MPMREMNIRIEIDQDGKFDVSYLVDGEWHVEQGMNLETARTFINSQLNEKLWDLAETLV